MALSSVPYGPYAGWTLAMVQARLAKVDAALVAAAPGSMALQSASVNGNAFSFISGHQDSVSIREEKQQLLEALYYLDDNAKQPLGNFSVFASE